eukprot:749161-Hanusia_phi.AAC.1
MFFLNKRQCRSGEQIRFVLSNLSASKMNMNWKRSKLNKVKTEKGWNSGTTAKMMQLKYAFGVRASSRFPTEKNTRKPTLTRKRQGDEVQRTQSRQESARKSGGGGSGGRRARMLGFPYLQFRRSQTTPTPIISFTLHQSTRPSAQYNPSYVPPLK